MRWFRMLFSAAVFVVAIVAAAGSPTAVRAAVPPEHQAVLWQHACEDVAQGTVSPQEALVCVHSGFPMWDDRPLEVVQRICEHPLGGTYEYRSEFPSEFAACFFS
jgi:hypothetical protein